MKFKGRMQLEHGFKQMDIAPLVNIFFLLLIFFMLSSNFITQPGMNVDLPKAITSGVVKHDNLEIMVSSENAAYFSNKALDNQQLKDLLKLAAKRGQPILIKADRRASLGRVVEVWDLARDMGISQVNIATNQE